MPFYVVVHRFLTSFAFTVIVETTVVFLLLRYVFRLKVDTFRVLLAGFFASLSTIPYVWFVFPTIAQGLPGSPIIYAEAFAFGMETVFYRYFLNIDWRVAAIISFVANVASFTLGPILRANGLWIYW